MTVKYFVCINGVRFPRKTFLRADAKRIVHRAWKAGANQAGTWFAKA